MLVHRTLQLFFMFLKVFLIVYLFENFQYFNNLVLILLEVLMSLNSLWIALHLNYHSVYLVSFFINVLIPVVIHVFNSSFLFLMTISFEVHVCQTQYRIGEKASKSMINIIIVIC